MSPTRLAAHCLELLGVVAGPVAVLVPRAPALRAALDTRLSGLVADGTPTAAVVAFIGAPGRPEERQRLLRDLQQRLLPGARLVLVDHNQPRAWWRRVLAAASLVLAGFGPARARYPAARELAALGFTIERLRLGPGERIQLIVARRS